MKENLLAIHKQAHLIAIQDEIILCLDHQVGTEDVCVKNILEIIKKYYELTSTNPIRMRTDEIPMNDEVRKSRPNEIKINHIWEH